MTNLHTLNRRLDRLDGTGGHMSFGDALEAAHERAMEREREWRAAGNTGPLPPMPLQPCPPGATRAERDLWRKLAAEGRARVLHMSGDQPSPFRDFSEIYSMSDADLLEVINRAEKST